MLHLVYDSSTIMIRICNNQSDDGLYYAATPRFSVKEYYVNYLTWVSTDMFEN